MNIACPSSPLPWSEGRQGKEPSCDGGPCEEALVLDSVSSRLTFTSKCEKRWAAIKSSTSSLDIGDEWENL